MANDEYEFIAVCRHAHGVLITLLSHTLKTALLAELLEAVRSIETQRLVISGRNGFFAAGADIAELTALDGPRALDYSRLGQSVYNGIANHSSVTVAAIDGYCMGGGLDLALACDLRYATKTSTFAHPGGRIGIMTGWGGTHRLPRIIGRSRALEMMAVGRRLNATEALDWGLISAITSNPLRILTSPDWLAGSDALP